MSVEERADFDADLVEPEPGKESEQVSAEEELEDFGNFMAAFSGV